MARTRVEDEGPGQEIEVSTGSVWVRDPVVSHAADPFDKTDTELRKMDGLSPAFKKKVSREITKYQRGADGAKSKQMTEEAAFGYFRLEVVTPPYNMEYLSKLYEINAAHKAAVDAKVTNIVGLGYDLVESHKMRQAMQNSDGPDKVDKARKKIDRIKNEI